MLVFTRAALGSPAKRVVLVVGGVGGVCVCWGGEGRCVVCVCVGGSVCGCEYGPGDSYYQVGARGRGPFSLGCREQVV